MHLQQPYAIALVSDVHLRHVNDSRSQLLIQLLQSLAAAPITHFVLLGDIFDFCFGRSPYFRSVYQPLGDALIGLVQQGKQVHFLEGNHEFGMELMGWQGVNIHHGPSFSLPVAAQLKAVFTHGDLLIPDFSYQVFRSVLKSRLVSLGACCVPARLLNSYALAHARVSRSQDKYRSVDHGKLIQHATSWLQEQTGDLGVFGHFHIPYHVQVLGHRRLLSVNSWDRPNILLIKEDGSVERAFFRGGKWSVVEAKLTPLPTLIKSGSGTEAII